MFVRTTHPKYVGVVYMFSFTRTHPPTSVASVTAPAPAANTATPPVAMTRAHFKHIVETTPGITIFKFGASWCGPCRRVEPQVMAHLDALPPKVTAYVVDVDVSTDVFAYLKSKKIVPGVPTLLMYAPHSNPLTPVRVVSGADPAQIDAFFRSGY